MNIWLAAAGAGAALAWFAAAPPWRDGIRGLLRVGGALLVLAGLAEVTCRLPSSSSAPRLKVLVDRSGSMAVAGTDGITRARAASMWLDGEPFGRWTEGWEVQVDSFGGAASDPGAAVEGAVEEGPDAILVVSDGRVQAGRSIERWGVPIYVLVPDPTAVSDAAILDLRVDGDTDLETATVETAAAGGLPLPAGRLEVSVDGRPVGRRDLPALEPGERRVIRLPLPPAGSEPSVVTARVVVEGDPVPDNDARSRIREPIGPRRALAVALGPTWDFAAWVRALEAGHPGPVDVFWSFPGGGLRPADASGTAAWGALAVDRYAAVYLFGDPAALATSGRAWISRFTAVGGRALLWVPAKARGELPGTGAAIRGERAPAVPVLTPAGRAWLLGLGADPGAAPDGGPGWPPLEELPATAVPPAGATVLLEAGGSPAAWVAERETRRVAVLLGTGSYRWPLASGAGPDPGPHFWTAWSDGLIRWLAAASPAIRPLVRLPPGRTVAASESLRFAIADDTLGLRWRIEAGERVVGRGAVEGGDPAAAITAAPLPPGSYRLVVEASGRTTTEPFVVEPWSPELAWTAADTAGLLAAARRTGGGAVGPGTPQAPLPADRGDRSGREPRQLALGTWPWTFLGAAVLVISDWALAVRRRR